eukprot:TRINITY_DN550_c0_g3_i1.p1 TRINITY_DN550_c0_g3~~TRINITY_DN550_c0_g3_i1.p1  ORF type:complete len:181 (-),score=20.43 TRINITY_DN550_c0_g3_i1:23-565(-)
MLDPNSESIVKQGEKLRFQLGGENTVYYPLLIEDLNWFDGTAKFEILKADTHDGGNWTGSFVLSLTYHCGCSDHGAGAVVIKHSYVEGVSPPEQTFLRPFGGYVLNHMFPRAVVYLRGSTPYTFRSLRNDQKIDFRAEPKAIVVPPPHEAQSRTYPLIVGGQWTQTATNLVPGIIVPVSK